MPPHALAALFAEDTRAPVLTAARQAMQHMLPAALRLGGAALRMQPFPAAALPSLLSRMLGIAPLSTMSVRGQTEQYLPGETHAEPMSFEHRAAMISAMLRSAGQICDRVEANRDAASVRIASARYELDRLHEELSAVLTVPMARRSTARRSGY